MHCLTQPRAWIWCNDSNDERVRLAKQVKSPLKSNHGRPYRARVGAARARERPPRPAIARISDSFSWPALWHAPLRHSYYSIWFTDLIKIRLYISNYPHQFIGYPISTKSYLRLYRQPVGTRRRERDNVVTWIDWTVYLNSRYCRNGYSTKFYV